MSVDLIHRYSIVCSKRLTMGKIKHGFKNEKQLHRRTMIVQQKRCRNGNDNTSIDATGDQVYGIASQNDLPDLCSVADDNLVDNEGAGDQRTGRRVVELGILADALSACKRCGVPLQLSRATGITTYGLAAIIKGEHVKFNTTKVKYNIGDTVTLTCFVKSDWLMVSVGRNGYDLGICFTKYNRCVPTAGIQDRYGNYELKLEKSRPMLVIKNVTKDDHGADFTCHWTTYTATTSFAVTDEHVQLEATRTKYKVGDIVTLTCDVRSDWLMVSFGRNNSDIGYCFTIMNECYTTADIRDKYGNYELKLEKSRPMLVIKNVTIDEDGADFTCQWTSYTDTTSFAVTDIAETTLSIHEESISDSSTVLVVVLLSMVVIALVIVIGIIVIVRQPVFYRRIGERFIHWLERRRNEHVQAPINTDTERTRDTGQELQTITHTFSDDIENITSLSLKCDVKHDHQKHLDSNIEDAFGPKIHGTECVTTFLERRTDKKGRHQTCHGIVICSRKVTLLKIYD